MALLALLAALAGAGEPLVLRVDAPDDAEVWCALYDDARAWSRPRRAAATVRAVREDDGWTCRFEDVPPGPHAVMVHDDRDEDGRLDRGMFGTPQEPWTTSEGAGEGSRFDRAAFVHPGAPTVGRLRSTVDASLLPGAFYSQETSLGFGALATVTFGLPHTGRATWPSSIGVAVVGTILAQASLELSPAFYLGRDNDLAIEAAALIEHFPTRFYGVGPTTGGSWQGFTRRQAALDVEVRGRVVDRLYLGGTATVVATEVRGVGEERSRQGEALTEPSGQRLLGDGVPGEDGSRVVGAGALIRWDSRDNVQSTRDGVMIDARAAGHPGWLGSTHPHAFVGLDGRVFHTVGGATLAAHLLVQARFGDVPFSAMGELGGDEVLRGLYQGRFRDHHLAALDLEVRSPMILRRFRLVALAGAGQVFGPDEARAPLAMIAGGGVRFEVDQRSHLVIRLDLAGGPDGAGMVFTAGEAF